jgi:hypothetical protein
VSISLRSREGVTQIQQRAKNSVSQTTRSGTSARAAGYRRIGSPTSTPTPTSASAAASVRGARELRFDALAGSLLPAQLTAMGYIVEKIGTSERILPHAVAQRFEVSSSGALVPASDGSKKPTTATVTNAGFANVEQFELRLEKVIFPIFPQVGQDTVSVHWSRLVMFLTHVDRLSWRPL